MIWLTSAAGLLVGLIIFLVSAGRFADQLKMLAGDRMKALLEKLTINNFAGLLTGIIVTAILDSSSVVIILLIALVHAGVLSFERSLAVILGANIGTTVSSQIYAFEADRFAPFLLGIGILMVLGWRNQNGKEWGYAILFLGSLLFGLHLMGMSMAPAAESPALLEWLRKFENPATGAAAGAAITALIQSSSAMIGIATKLADAGLLTLPGGVAMMLGGEIGTCLDTLISSIGRSREAVRAGLFHLFFNVTTVILGLLLYQQLTAAATWLPGEGPARQIANAHMLFNVAGALLFLPLTPACAALLRIVIPQRLTGTAAEEQVQTA